VAVVEQIAEAFKLSEKFDHVTFSFPGRDRLSLTVDVLGWVVGLTHGHVARAAGSASAKLLAWFKSMAASKDPIGDSQLLFTGHYHHVLVTQLIGDTWLLQAGALCDVSSWFSQTYGLVSDPAILKGTITRENKLEKLMPYTWNRTITESTEI
jgi:predicted phosphodiesterase